MSIIGGISVCDTSSVLYKQDKIKFLKTFTINGDMQNVVAVFKNPDADTETVINARLPFLVSLYRFNGGKQNTPSLNNFRLKYFI